MRAVKCDCLVLSLWRRSTIYCFYSSPQFCRICDLVIQRLHKLSPLLSFMFVRYSGDLIVHLWQGGRGKSLNLRSSRALSFSNISVGTGSVFIRCRPEGMWCDAASKIMARKIFSPFWQSVGSRLLLSFSSISLLYRSQFAFSG